MTLQILWQTILAILGWCAITEVLALIIPCPKSILQIDDKAERNIKYHRYISCCTAIIHGAIATVMSLYLSIANGVEFGQVSHSRYIFPLIYSTSYFFYDLIYGYFKKYNDFEMHFHHICSGVLVGWCLYTGKYGQEMVFALFQGEITSPLLNISEILDTNKAKKKLSQMLMMAFLVVFLLMRPTFSFWTLIQIQINPYTDILYKILPTFVWGLSMHWAWMMINKAVKLLHTTDPENKNKEKIYKVVRAGRKYHKVYMAGITYVCLHFLVSFYWNKSS